MRVSIRRIKILILNIMSYPSRIKNNIAMSAILQDANISKNTIIGSKVKFYRSSLGKFSYVQNNSFICDCKIGKYTSISTGCYIGGAAHPLEWGATSIHFYCTGQNEEGRKKYFYKKYFDPFKQTIIGNDVWIGANVMIKAGVTISDGAVIGMGSVVTKDVGPYEIWAGNPAKFIRKRFDDKTCERLYNSKWWDLNEESLKLIDVHISDTEKFLEEIEKL